ncbi:hypothetical protein Scel_81070 [Streptomyces cellostaticus]|nr:hypothetical protein Scel_81070 [Streptomyces cellostaticus]
MGEPLDHGQAQAGAVVVGVSGTPEPVEGPLSVGFGHAWALVGHMQFDRTAAVAGCGGGRQGDGGAGRGDAQCVGQQVVEDLFECARYRPHLSGLRAGHGDADALFAGEGRPDGRAVGDDGVEVDGLGGDRRVLQPGEGEQPLDHAAEAGDLVDRVAETVLRAGGEVGLEVLQTQAQGGQGGLELVRRFGGEGLLGVEQVLEPGCRAGERGGHSAQLGRPAVGGRRVGQAAVGELCGGTFQGP